MISRRFSRMRHEVPPVRSEVLKKIHQLLKLHKQRRREREEREASRNEKRAEVALDNLMHEVPI